MTIAAGRKVRVDSDIQVAGMTIEGELYFSPSRSARVDSTANIVVTGRLVMIPDHPGIKHHLQFLGVNESSFTGKGMDVIDSDVGLWVMEQGQLITQGAAKRGWSNATGSIASGATQVTVEDASGWQIGDKIAIAPTALPPFDGSKKRTYDGFHDATVTSVNGNRVSFSPATTDGHPKVNGEWTAEVMNLTRNVVISGEDINHKTHVFIRAERPQFIRYAELRFVAPGKVSDGGYQTSGQVEGRYGLHLHHGETGMRGTIIEGVSMHQFGHHGFVTHMTHGVTLRDTVAYDGGNSPYWWDKGDDSNDILWDRAIGGKTVGLNAVFFLGSGDNVEVRNSVAVGAIVKTNSAGFEWENGTDGSWEFTNNVAHNLTGNGIRIWQNTSADHILQDFDVYHVTEHGVTVGAYTNNYHFKDFDIYGTGYSSFKIFVTPRPSPGADVEAEPPSLLLERGVIDGGGFTTDNAISINHSAVPGAYPVRIRDVTIKGRSAQRAPAIEMVEEAGDKKIDMIDVTIEPGPTPDFYLHNGTASSEGDGQSWIRVQNGNEAYRLRPRDQNRDSGATLVGEWNAWKKSIPPFRPSSSGTGTGLLGEYYDDIAMTDKVYTGVDPYIEIFIEAKPVYHMLDKNDTAVRWTGQVQAQQTGSYRFRAEGDRSRLWVNGQQIINNWNGGGANTGSINLTANQKYDIVLEIGDNHKQSDRDLFFNAHLYWKQPNYPIEQWVPQSQLYLPSGISALPFTMNDPPIAQSPRLG